MDQGPSLAILVTSLQVRTRFKSAVLFGCPPNFRFGGLDFYSKVGKEGTTLAAAVSIRRNEIQKEEEERAKETAHRKLRA